MSLSNAQKTEMAALYASFLLYDAKKDITADNLLKIAKAANVSLDKSQAELLGKILNKQSVETLIGKLSKVGGAAPAAAPAPAKDDKKDAKKDDKKDDKKKAKEPEPVADDDGGDMGFGSLF